MAYYRLLAGWKPVVADLQARWSYQRKDRDSPTGEKVTGAVRPVLLHLRRMGVAYIVLLVGLFLTTLSWYYVQRNVELQNRDRFDETVQVSREAIDRQTNSYVGRHTRGPSPFRGE